MAKCLLDFHATFVWVSSNNILPTVPSKRGRESQVKGAPGTKRQRIEGRTDHSALSLNTDVTPQQNTERTAPYLEISVPEPVPQSLAHFHSFEGPRPSCWQSPGTNGQDLNQERAFFESNAFNFDVTTAPCNGEAAHSPFQTLVSVACSQGGHMPPTLSINLLDDLSFDQASGSSFLAVSGPVLDDGARGNEYTSLPGLNINLLEDVLAYDSTVPQATFK